jgi:hypothetical protein
MHYTQLFFFLFGMLTVGPRDGRLDQLDGPESNFQRFGVRNFSGRLVLPRDLQRVQVLVAVAVGPPQLYARALTE